MKLLTILLMGFVMASQAWAQGSLTPPGAPGETMKSLAQVEPRTPIESLPYTIGQPGSYYLAGNLTSAGNGIVVTCGNVTIDLMGFTLTGTASGTGILVEPTSGALTTLCVKNGTVRRFGTGIQWEGVRGSVLADLVVESNAWHGIYFMGNGAPASANRIERCTVSGNTGSGIFFSSYSVANNCNDNRIEDCLIANNAQYGIQLEGSQNAQCDGNVIQNVTANRNGIGGIYLQGTGGSCNGNTIKGCQASGNASSGIKATAECLRNRIEGNTATGNGKGLDIYGSGNVVADNMVSGNTDNYDFSQANQLNILLGEIPETIDWPCSIRLAGSFTCSQTGVNGITVNANDVAIDLAGNTLTGPGLGSKSGISQSSAYRNLRVQNGKLVNWRAASDVDEAGLKALGTGTIVSDVQAATNRYGIFCQGDGVLIERCHAYSNEGLGLVASSSCAINNCVARYNGQNGIQAYSAAIVNGCESSYNGSAGFLANTDSIFTDCMSTHNLGNGFTVGTRSTVKNCVASYNRADGLNVTAECYIFNNQCARNGNEGDGAGIHTLGARNRIDSNHVVANDRGIDVDITGNLIVRNSAHAQGGDNYDIPAGNGDAHVVVPASGFTTAEPWANFSF